MSRKSYYPFTLDLEYNGIGDEGAIALSQGNLTSLTTICLGGADGLSQGNFSNLTTFNLDSNSLRVKGAGFLSQGNLSNLTTLYSRYT